MVELPCSPHRPVAVNSSYNVRHYWKKDIISVSEVLRHLKKEVELGSEGAVENLEGFRAEQKALTERRLEVWHFLYLRIPLMLILR